MYKTVYEYCVILCNCPLIGLSIRLHGGLVKVDCLYECIISTAASALAVSEIPLSLRAACTEATKAPKHISLVSSVISKMP